MNFLNTSTPILGSILSLKFVDVADVVSIPEPDLDNLIDLNAIQLLAGKEFHTMEALPNTGSMVIENVENEQGSFELPNIKLKLNNVNMAELNKLHQLALGRYIVIPKDGSGNEYLCGHIEQWLKLKFKLDTNASRANTQVIDVEFSFS